MVGIDHNKAPIDVRSLFSFTKMKSIDAMCKLVEIEGIKGSIILSTCNRMEVWVEVDDHFEDSLYTHLCQIKEVHTDAFSHLFVSRKEEEAVEHLFQLVCGLKSQILGEDQIITQVREALAIGRENDTTTNTLEVLFRMAITVGKKVKTKVTFPRENFSAIERAVSLLQENNVQIEDKKCMVIGNGQMGKLAACSFRDAVAKVYMTVRQYRHGVVELPSGCKVLDYEARADFIEGCEIVVSATTSPHFTITKEMLMQRKNQSPLILIDLAVPRDIETTVKDIEFVTLYDIDDFKTNTIDHKMTEAMDKANDIIGKEIEVFYHWLEGSSMVPKIQVIKEEVAKDMCLRLQKKVGKLEVEEKVQEKLMQDIEKAAQNTVNKMLFHLKDVQSTEEFVKALDGLENLYTI